MTTGVKSLVCVNIVSPESLFWNSVSHQQTQFTDFTEIQVINIWCDSVNMKLNKEMEKRLWERARDNAFLSIGNFSQKHGKSNQWPSATWPWGTRRRRHSKLSKYDSSLCFLSFPLSALVSFYSAFVRTSGFTTLQHSWKSLSRQQRQLPRELLTGREANPPPPPL